MSKLDTEYTPIDDDNATNITNKTSNNDITEYETDCCGRVRTKEEIRKQRELWRFFLPIICSAFYALTFVTALGFFLHSIKDTKSTEFVISAVFFALVCSPVVIIFLCLSCWVLYEMCWW